MNKRFILFLLVSAVILFGWAILFPRKQPEPKPVPTEETAEAPEASEGEKAATGEEPTEPVKKEPTEELETEEVPLVPVSKRAVTTGVELSVSTPLYEAKYKDGGLASISLTRYPADVETLLFQRLNKSPVPVLAPVFGDELAPDAKWSVDKTRIALDGTEEGTAVWKLTSGEDVLFVSRMTFYGESYDVDIGIETPGENRPITVSVGGFKKEEDDQGDVDDVSFETLIGSEKPRDKLKGDDGIKTYEGDVPWAALRSKYFIIALIPDNAVSAEMHRKKKETIEGYLTLAGPGKLTMYAGPKNYSTLRTKGIGLERTVDLGWSFIGWIAAVILMFLNWINQYIGNYGLSIIVLTFVIKIITYPLTMKSLTSSKRMQEVQPVLKEVQKKYKDNPEKLNQEMMEVYRRYKINPLGGCLPLIIQIPIFYAFFNTLRNAVDLKGAPFFLWVTDLSKPDALFDLGFTIPFVDASTFNVLPLVMTAVWAVQMITGQPTGAVKSEQQKLMMIMPIVFGFLLYNMPSGLVIYWTVNTLLTLVQQIAMTRFSRQKEGDGK
jgi:YidC/Oxa1 family membrane protein insertase